MVVFPLGVDEIRRRPLARAANAALQQKPKYYFVINWICAKHRIPRTAKVASLGTIIRLLPSNTRAMQIGTNKNPGT
jgi:hypothetical protein